MTCVTLESLRGSVPDAILACCWQTGDCVRFKLDLPWVETYEGVEYVVASDGRIAGRIRRDLCKAELPEIPKDQKVPHLGRDLDVMWKAEYRPGFALPDVGAEKPPQQCEHCKGTGRVRVGRGTDECYKCDGVGTITPLPLRIVIDDASNYGVGEDYVRRLRSFGVRSVELPLKTVGRARAVKRTWPARFQIAHVEGLLMPNGNAE